MKKRNTPIYILKEIPYVPGAPVVITAGCLVKDGVSGKLRCQMEIAGLSDEPIREVTVLLYQMNADGDAVAPAQRQRFQNLSLKKDGTIGGKTEAVLNGKNVSAVTVETEKVVFKDGRTWQAEENAEWQMIPHRQTLEEAYGDERMAEQYRIRFGEDCRYLPWEGEEIWYCTCGTVNRTEDGRCRRCRRVRKALMRVNTDEIRKETDRRQDREQRLDEESSADKKKRKWVWAVIPAALIVAATVIFVIFGSGKLLQRTEKTAETPTVTEAPAEETPEPAETPEATPTPTPEELKEDPEEAERKQAYEKARMLMDRANAGDASALSEIGKTQEDVAEGETAIILLYRAALETFESLGGYAESEACAAHCREGIASQEQLVLQQRYASATALLEDRRYSEACRKFGALGDYGDSSEMVKEATYRKAVGLCDVIRGNDVRAIYAQISMDPEIGSRFVLAGDQAPDTDSSCAQSLLAACGNDPAELTRADVIEESMPTLADAVRGLFESLGSYRDSDACIADIEAAMDYTKDFYRLCAEGDLEGAQAWLNTWGDELGDREFWQERLDRFLPYCGAWEVYSGDMSIIPYIVDRGGVCSEFSTHVSIGEEDAVLHMTARDGEEEYGIDFYFETNKEYFYNSDYPPYSYLMVINGTGRMSSLMYNADTGTLLTSCEYKRPYNGG